MGAYGTAGAAGCTAAGTCSCLQLPHTLSHAGREATSNMACSRSKPSPAHGEKGLASWVNARELVGGSGPTAGGRPANPPHVVNQSTASRGSTKRQHSRARAWAAMHRTTTTDGPFRTTLDCEGAAMSKVGGAGGLPRRLPGRLVPPLVLLPLALHVQGRHQLPALRLEALGNRKGAAALAPKHLHAQGAGGELVGRELQGLLAAAARRRERLKPQGDLRRVALAVHRHHGLGEAPSSAAVDEEQGLRRAAASSSGVGAPAAPGGVLAAGAATRQRHGCRALGGNLWEGRQDLERGSAACEAPHLPGDAERGAGRD